MALVQLVNENGVDFDKLYFDEEVLKNMAKLDNKARSQVLTVVATFNKYGPSRDMFGNKIEPLKGNKKYQDIFELKVKSLAKREWRFLYIKDKLVENRYIFLHGFLKKTTEIEERDKKKAYTVAKRENLISP
jgi:phage-related protein